MPLYEYECRSCGDAYEVVSGVDSRPERIHCPCGKMASRIISMPVIQTLSTHMRGVSDVNMASDGSYVDENLCNPQTGEPQTVRSLEHKKQLLSQFGLEQKTDFSPRVRDIDKYKSKRPVSVSS